MTKHRAATAVLDVPPPEEVCAPAPPPPKARSWRVNFRQKDSTGKPRPHPWLPPTLILDGCASEDEAREKLRALVEAAVFQVEPERA